MAIGQAFHGLTEEDLAAVADARYTSEIISQLTLAQSSRNALLLEALRRTVAEAGYAEAAGIIEAAALLLSEIQAGHPEIVRKLLVLPQFGLWAADCLIKLKTTAGHGQTMKQEIEDELGYISAFAATAALLAGRSVDLRLPVRDGVAYLPALAQVRLDDSAGTTWAQLRSEGAGAASLAGPGRRPALLRLDRARERVAGWHSAPRLRVRSRGLCLSVALDHSDPFLSRLGPVPSSPSREFIQAWRRRVRQVWQILTGEDQRFAGALAVGLTTLVPLQQVAGAPPTSAASGWAWGAIGLTLPPDPLIFAETLIHEFQHLVLAAVEDIVPLAEGDDEDLFYSPWRNDPRPFSNVLQGAYAFFGVADFWRRQCHADSPAVRRRAETNFAMRRRNVSDALAIVTESGRLTDTGQMFVRRMQERSADWLADPVPPHAEKLARQSSLEHQLRWRLANLSADPQGRRFVGPGAGRDFIIPSPSAHEPFDAPAIPEEPRRTT